MPSLSLTGDGPGGGGEDEVVDVPAPGGAAALVSHGALPPLSKNVIPLSLCAGGGRVAWKKLGGMIKFPLDSTGQLCYTD